METIKGEITLLGEKEVTEDVKLDYAIGTKVVHVPEGVCKIQGICKLRDWEGNWKKYYRVASVVDEKTIVYVPMEAPETCIRLLKEKEEMEAIFEDLHHPEGVWIKEEQKRRAYASHVIATGDVEEVAKMIALYVDHERKSHLNLSDRKVLKEAEQYLFTEMAEVFGEEYEKFTERLIKDGLAY